MPVNRGASKKALKANIKQFMHDAKAGTSKHIKTKSQALAAAYSEQRAAKKKARKRK